MPDTLKVGAQFDVTPITAGMKTAADSVERETARMNRTFNLLGTESEAASERVAYSTTEARHALHGLGEEMGVHVPRFVQSFVAEMGPIGPLLANAFSAIAVIGLLQVLAELPEALNKIIEKFSGWDAEAKKTYEDIVSGNRQLQIENLKLEDQMRRIALVSKIGTTETSRARLEIDLLGKSTKDTALLLADFLRTRVQAEEELHKLTTEVSVGAIFDLAHSGKIEDAKKHIESLTKVIEELEKKLREAPVETAKAQAEQTEAFKREREEAERFHDEMIRFGDDLARKDLEELRRMQQLAREKERLDEEMEKATYDAAKKDLEDFERAMIDKTRLQEDAGKGELEQIRAQFDRKQRLIEAMSSEKGGDKVTVLAFQSLDEQTTQISKLIALEEQLRQKLIEIGIAETDPKIQESLKREQELVQQANIAWQKYQQTVNQVAIDQEKQFRKSFDQISNELNRNLISWIGHQQSFGQAMANVWNSIASQAINSILRIAEEELIGHLLHKSIQDQQKLDDAKAAARGAYSAVAGIPIIGPILAPIAAATAFAGVMAFEQGGIIQGSAGKAVPIVGHAGEAVLPQPLTHLLTNVANSSVDNSRAQTIHHHHNSPNITVHQHGGSMNPAEITRAVRKGMRYGHSIGYPNV